MSRQSLPRDSAMSFGCIFFSLSTGCIMDLCSTLVKDVRRLFTGVNFINVPRTNFSYEHRFRSFFYVHVNREKLTKQRSYEKLARKMLMKLTAGVNSPTFTCSFYASRPKRCKKDNHVIIHFWQLLNQVVYSDTARAGAKMVWALIRTFKSS